MTTEQYFRHAEPDAEGIIDLTPFQDPKLEMSAYAQRTILTADDPIATLAEYLERDRASVAGVVEDYFMWVLTQLAHGYILRLPAPDGPVVYLRFNRDTECYQQVFGRLPAELALMEIRFDNHRKLVPDNLRIIPLGSDLMEWDDDIVA